MSSVQNRPTKSQSTDYNDKISDIFRLENIQEECVSRRTTHTCTKTVQNTLEKTTYLLFQLIDFIVFVNTR